MAFGIRGLRRTFTNIITNDMAIDLGTASTLIYIEHQGVVLKQPSVISYRVSDRSIVAVGDEAKEMYGRTPSGLESVKPMKDGVVSDFALVEEMLRYFMHLQQKRGLMGHPRVLVSVPTGITAVESRAVKDSVERAGAREVYLVYEPLAAAIGVDIDVLSPSANMVIDIGGGTTEIAVIALAGIVANGSARIGGDEMDEYIQRWMKNVYHLDIGVNTAENIKKNVGSAFVLDEEKYMEVRGMEIDSGIPKSIKIGSSEVREALKEPVKMIVQAVKDTLRKTKAELSNDIVDKGIVMTGGGSLLKGLSDLIQEETNIRVTVAENAEESVVRGAGKILANLEIYEKVIMKGEEE
ncbi:MAG: rod shape-determining protein [bacterium]